MMTIVVISMIRDSWGGSEELWYQMAKVALKQGHKVIHVAYENPVKHHKIKELEGLGLLRILRPGWIPQNSSFFKKYAYLGKNYLRKRMNSPIRKIFAQKPDLILYNGTCYSISHEKELINSVKKSKVDFYILGELNNESLRLISDEDARKIKEAYLLCKKVLFVSNRNLETAQRHLYTKISNAQVIRNPVNLFQIEQTHFLSAEARIQFACVGNLVTVHKGQDILFEALSKWENKNWDLNIYGSGYDKEYLQNLALYLNLEKQIIFHGSVNDIREVWKTNHALLMPSHMEGMPLAVVEAMLCGRVCIATNVGGISEWITHKKNGFIAEASTVHSLLNVLEEAYSQKRKWPEIGAEAHKTAMQLYDPNAGATLLNILLKK